LFIFITMTGSDGKLSDVPQTENETKTTTKTKTEIKTAKERIKVVIRMRPLNDKETSIKSNNRVWRVLPKCNSVTQTTISGKPLEQRLYGRTFFSFDKTFGENDSTKQLYDSIVKGILQSVINGMNGTIFSCGQTSSGKTYTMQGSGTIEEGISGKGGIIHLVANDIFSYIANDPQRIFLIRVSFVEVYNEEVRDLLFRGNGENVLTIGEDPRKGFFVNATENFVTDFQSLLYTLFAGEKKKRSFAATNMNERASRSHTIFRIIVESRKRLVVQTDDVGSDNNEMVDIDSVCSDDHDGAVRVSTLNLVDLAGSESVRHIGSTRKRQKEGAKVNQSLLTISHVIEALGTPKRKHINFRESKLTRMLYFLSGNTRMAIICCTTPSDLYKEETRSILQFASRAKLIKTKSQINEVLDDTPLIKKLQRKLASAKESSKALESEAVTAGKIAKKEQTLQRLKESILRGGLLYDFFKPQINDDYRTVHVIGTPIESDNIFSPVRRENKGYIPDNVLNMKRVLADITPVFLSPRGSQTTKKINRFSEIKFLKDAFNSKAVHGRFLQKQISEYKALLFTATEEIDQLKKLTVDTESESIELLARINKIEEEKERMMETQSTLLEEKDSKIQEVGKAMEKLLTDKKNVDSLVVSLKSQNEDLMTSKENMREVQSIEIRELKEHVQQLELSTSNSTSSEQSNDNRQLLNTTKKMKRVKKEQSRQIGKRRSNRKVPVCGIPGCNRGFHGEGAGKGEMWILCKRQSNENNEYFPEPPIWLSKHLVCMSCVPRVGQEIPKFETIMQKNKEPLLTPLEFPLLLEYNYMHGSIKDYELCKSGKMKKEEF